MFGNTLIDTLARALVFILPAYCANAMPVLLGGGRPIDGGKLFPDDRPIFGAHKTIRGFFSGLIVGTLVGFGLSLVINYSVLLGFAVSLGALLGDLFKAFAKRRLGYAPGASLPVADQLDFVLGALLFSLPVSQPSWQVVIVVLIITPPIHLLTNFVAYQLGVKKEPW
jgi:CDP-2,3-bis-(O-geranylgeranyl)-sn-glycerol synthase